MDTLLQDMAADDNEHIWGPARQRLQDLDSNSVQRDKLRGLLLPLPRQACRGYFRGDNDDEVRAMLNVLLGQGACGQQGWVHAQADKGKGIG